MQASQPPPINQPPPPHIAWLQRLPHARTVPVRFLSVLSAVCVVVLLAGTVVTNTKPCRGHLENLSHCTDTVVPG